MFHPCLQRVTVLKHWILQNVQKAFLNLRYNLQELHTWACAAVPIFLAQKFCGPEPRFLKLRSILHFTGMSAKPITNMRARSMKRTAAACSTHYKTSNWLWHDFGTCCFLYRVFVPKTLQIQKAAMGCYQCPPWKQSGCCCLGSWLHVFWHLLFSLWLEK